MKYTFARRRHLRHHCRHNRRRLRQTRCAVAILLMIVPLFGDVLVLEMPHRGPPKFTQVLHTEILWRMWAAKLAGFLFQTSCVCVLCWALGNLEQTVVGSRIVLSQLEAGAPWGAAQCRDGGRQWRHAS